MTEQVEEKKLPWPSRLVNISVRYVKVGFVIGFSGIMLAAIARGIVGSVVLISGACVLILACLLALTSIIGCAFYRFKVPGAGKAFLVLILTYPAVALGLAIVGPSLTQASNKSLYECKSNIRSLGLCVVFYHSDNDVWPTHTWCDVLEPYYAKKETLLCPKDKIGPCSYAMNEGIPADAGALPGDLVVLFESAPGWNAVGSVDDVVTDRHKKTGANIAFADARVEFVEADAIPKLRWTVVDSSVERE